MSTSRGRMTWFLSLAVALMALAPAGLAQAKPPRRANRDDSAQRATIVIPTQVIRGARQKPEAYYILRRQAVDYEWQDLEKAFAPKVLESVSHGPF